MKKQDHERARPRDARPELGAPQALLASLRDVARGNERSAAAEVRRAVALHVARERQWVVSSGPARIAC